jgi:predicted nucleic acid-binding Zn ribbon protein
MKEMQIEYNNEKKVKRAMLLFHLIANLIY